MGDSSWFPRSTSLWATSPLRQLIGYHSAEAIPLTRAILQATIDLSRSRGAIPIFVWTNYGRPCEPSDRRHIRAGGAAVFGPRWDPRSRGHRARTDAGGGRRCAPQRNRAPIPRPRRPRRPARSLGDLGPLRASCHAQSSRHCLEIRYKRAAQGEPPKPTETKRPLASIWRGTCGARKSTEALSSYEENERNETS